MIKQTKKTSPISLFTILASALGVLIVVVIHITLRTSIQSPMTPVLGVNDTSMKGSVTVPVTHTWYSSLFFTPFSQPLYVMPGTYKFTDHGVEIGAPTVTATQKTIFYPHVPEVYLTFDPFDKVARTQVTRAGEWDVEVEVKNQRNQSMVITLVKGSPVMYVNSTDAPLFVSGSIRSVNTLSEQQIVLNTMSGGRFLVDSQQEIQYDEPVQSITITPGTGITRIIQLPTAYRTGSELSQQELSSITGCSLDSAPSFTDFQVSLDNENNTYTVKQTFATNNTRPRYLFTVWPHQLLADPDVLSDKQILGNYKTHRGELALVCAQDFTYQINAVDLPLEWASVLDSGKLLSSDAKRLFDQDHERFQTINAPAGVYFKGKYLKDLVDLVQLSGLMGLSETHAALKSKAITLLMDEINSFTLNPTTGLVNHKNPEFGSEKGNDHHFQYSYYIYAYATVYENLDDKQQSQVRDLMALFQQEGIPGLNHSESYARKTRFFDPIEHHSWADSQALFADGNNQESSSEALFYWYAWHLWGDRVGNQEIKDLAQFLFSAELNARDAYWFLVNGEYPNNEYTSPIVSLVWGGKADYATWFSADDDKILGIQLLPINPSSAVSLKVPASTLTRLRGYYEPRFSTLNSQGFVNFFEYMKKINGVGGDFLPGSSDTEFISTTFYYLWR